MSDSTEERLDRIIALLSLAFAPEIERGAEAIRANAVASAILDGCDDWIESGSLQALVAKARGVSTRTVQRKMSELESMGLLVAQGAGRSRQIRNAGII